MSEFTSSNSTFESFDGTPLFYRQFSRGEIQKGGRTLIIMHRGHEHSGRTQEIAEKLVHDGMQAFAYDARGHGQSPGERGYADDFNDLVRDLEAFFHHLQHSYAVDSSQVVIVANSVGAVVTSTWVHDYAPGIRGMVLVAPAFSIKLYVPLALQGLAVMRWLKKPQFISSYVKARFLTHDKIEQQRYNNDPQITPQIAVNVLYSLLTTGRRIVADAWAITTPTMVLSAGSDYVVHNKVQRQFYQNLGSGFKDFREYPGKYHGLLYEQGREPMLEEVDRFIQRCYNLPLNREPQLTPSSYSQDEYRQLSLGMVPILHAAAYWGQRVMLNTVGRLSKGIRIGLRTGFDSGLSLDHVYSNKAEGITPLGRFLDHCYINTVGWQGIRQRKAHLMQVISQVIEAQLKRGQSVKIVDIATGGGKYLLETVAAYQKEDVQLVLRDHDIANIRQAQFNATALGVEKVSFEVMDAFATESYLNFKETTILVTSGLFELFSDNQMVLKALKSAGRTMAEGSALVYTGQPWHPQLEFISQCLSNREGLRWVMRRRRQKEMDDLATAAGFEKQSMLIDNWGIFTVSTAQRVQRPALDMVEPTRASLQQSSEPEAQTAT